LAWAIGFLEVEWVLKSMKWTVFVDKLVCSDWINICRLKPDLIVGGFSLATDYMYVLRTLRHMPPEPYFFF
jgi:hypothetical protein